jgi:raffinose/stachyose/melibiose transport system permease protein
MTGTLQRGHPLAAALSSAFRYAVSTLAVLIIGVPILYGFLGAFKKTNEILLARFWPTSFYLGNFTRVLSDARVLRGIFNSFYICFLALVVGCILCLLASVPIARRRERLFGVLYFVFLSSMIIPPISSFVTLYVMMVKMRLINKTLAVSLIFAIQFMVPIGTLIFTSFLKTVPVELEEAAKLEGCGFFRRIFLIIAPLIQAPILSLAVLQFPQAWNEFLIPLLFLRRVEARPLTLLIYNYTRDHESDFGAIFALIVVGMVVPLTLFLFSRKVIERSIGITAGGIKG